MWEWKWCLCTCFHNDCDFKRNMALTHGFINLSKTRHMGSSVFVRTHSFSHELSSTHMAIVIVMGTTLTGCVRFYLGGEMFTQESGHPVRGEDGVQGRPVLWVCLKHLLDQILQLVGQVTGEGRVRTPTHLKNQALPAGRLELDTRTRREQRWNNKPHRNIWATKNTQRIIELSWRYRASAGPRQCLALSHGVVRWQLSYFI